jgi:hypothetical protein
MRLTNITFDSANHLQWTNNHLDFVVGTGLFLHSISSRIEAQKFFEKKAQISSACLEQAPNLPDFANELRKIIKPEELGTSRLMSNKIMAGFFVACLPAILIFLIKRRSNPILREYLESNPVKSAFEGFIKYRETYLREYTKNELGGTWTPKTPNILSRIPWYFKGLVASKLILDNRVITLIKYLKDVTELSYNSHLDFWWFPTFTVVDDILGWVGDVPKTQLKTPTVDGLLGPVFPRLITDTFAEPENGVISDDRHYEYLLISMSKEERALVLGENHNRKIVKRLKKWGYVPAQKWKEMDFNMFIDRKLNLKSVERIAENYERDIATVVRRTGSLGQILKIQLPRAPYRKHRNH